jgi:hypothetical protein
MRAKHGTHTDPFKHVFRNTGVQTYFALYFVEEVHTQDRKMFPIEIVVFDKYILHYAPMR